MTHHHGAARDDLTGEHAWGDAGQMLFAVLFFVIWGLDSFVLHYTTFLNAYVPALVRIPLGVVLLGAAGYLASAGLRTVFGEERETPSVIREGVFGLVRHPVYLSEVLLYLGLLLISLSLAAAVVWGLATLFLHTISRYEERLLLDRFGEEYARYMRDVPMWIPRPRI